jgi:hypothetical protein
MTVPRRHREPKKHVGAKKMRLFNYIHGQELGELAKRMEEQQEKERKEGVNNEFPKAKGYMTYPGPKNKDEAVFLTSKEKLKRVLHLR